MLSSQPDVSSTSRHFTGAVQWMPSSLRENAMQLCGRQEK